MPGFAIQGLVAIDRYIVSKNAEALRAGSIVTGGQGRGWVLKSNSIQRQRWIGPCQAVID